VIVHLVAMARSATLRSTSSMICDYTSGSVASVLPHVKELIPRNQHGHVTTEMSGGRRVHKSLGQGNV
jgi:hypothetical protein